MADPAWGAYDPTEVDREGWRDLRRNVEPTPDPDRPAAGELARDAAEDRRRPR